MRLFHISEESDIKIFEPRTPTRTDLDKSVRLVWAINETCLPNYLTPRNCPRVTYHVGKNTSMSDRLKFFSSPTQTHAVIIERKWYQTMQSTTLYVYEFDPTDFFLQDEIAGYYVAKTAQKPKAKYVVNDLFRELVSRNIEIRIVDNLWNLADEVMQSTLDWSFCKMAFAQPRL